MGKDAHENAKNNFLFFIANVVAKSPVIEGLPSQFYYQVLKELLSR